MSSFSRSEVFPSTSLLQHSVLLENDTYSGGMVVVCLFSNALRFEDWNGEIRNRATERARAVVVCQ